MDFKSFFVAATSHEPYCYQAQVAEMKGFPSLLRIPTGAGKTEAAVLGWLYRYFHHPKPDVRTSTPRRLVYCLPMRTLVEQTAKRVDGWLERLGKTDEVGVVILMGGEPRDQWYLHPEKPYIIIGTQDMLLSRALNRGYGSNPAMWPVEYGLLNNDCLWVIDEVQIMANGLPTSTQVAGLRQKLKTFGPAHSIWMSATVKSDWLDTIDHGAPSDSEVLELGPADLENAELEKRYSARKIVSEVNFKTGSKYASELAEFIAETHEIGTLTLVIVNTVERSQAIYKALTKRKWVTPEADMLLVHSRFRGSDREGQRELLSQDVDESGPGRVVVATQTVEAGVDISAKSLITELAPWPSMVQRFGRCNRRGEDEPGRIFWVDMGDVKKEAAPYQPEDVEAARKTMKSFEGKSAGPREIEELGDVMQDVDHLTVIRRRDVVGLFDTTPDLSGSYLDVSQYVRGTDERNVFVFWREIDDDGPSEDEGRPLHSETVSVPRFGKGLDNYLKKDDRKAWRWDILDNGWIQVQIGEIQAGMTLMLDAAQGGYSPEIGWDPSSTDPVDLIQDGQRGPEDGFSSDHLSTGRKWVTLSAHTQHVETEAREILRELSEWLDEPGIVEAVGVAAHYHDTGKAHEAFQKMLRGKDTEAIADELMAKSPGKGKMDSSRPHFRHELGSALVVLQHVDKLGERGRDLAAYLVASHHGKVRLGIRSFPGQRRPGSRTDRNPDPTYLLGYNSVNSETLPAMQLDAGKHIDETELDLSIARIGLGKNGKRSWLERSLGLLEWLGPFRLAYLEAIIRAADMRASKKEREGSL